MAHPVCQILNWRYGLLLCICRAVILKPHKAVDPLETRIFCRMIETNQPETLSRQCDMQSHDFRLCLKVAATPYSDRGKLQVTRDLHVSVTRRRVDKQPVCSRTWQRLHSGERCVLRWMLRWKQPLLQQENVKMSLVSSASLCNQVTNRRHKFFMTTLSLLPQFLVRKISAQWNKDVISFVRHCCL
jgi:hypothetical protein